MLSLNLKRIEREFGFDSHAASFSSELEQRVSYTPQEIIKGCFDLIEEACDSLKIPAASLRGGTSDLRILELHGSPRLFPRLFSVSREYRFQGKPYIEAKKEAERYLSPTSDALGLGIELPHSSQIIFDHFIVEEDGVKTNGYDFEHIEITDPHTAIDNFYNISAKVAKGGTEWDKETLKREIEEKGDLSKGILKETKLFISPKLEEKNTLGLLKNIGVMWEQDLFYASKQGQVSLRLVH